MKSWASILSAIIIATTAGAGTGCGVVEDRTPPDEVAVQLKWQHQAQFAGFYAAEHNGYYAEEGLSITFIEGGPTDNNEEGVLNGTAQFGIAGADELIIARAGGKPVCAIATIYRRSPLAFVADADSGISCPPEAGRVPESKGGLSASRSADKRH